MNTEQLTKWLQRVDNRLMETEKGIKKFETDPDRDIIGIIDVSKRLDTYIKEDSAIAAGLDKKIKDLKKMVDWLTVALDDLREIQKEVVQVQSTATEKPIKQKSILAQILERFR